MVRLGGAALSESEDAALASPSSATSVAGAPGRSWCNTSVMAPPRPTRLAEGLRLVLDEFFVRGARWPRVTEFDSTAPGGAPSTAGVRDGRGRSEQVPVFAGTLNWHEVCSHELRPGPRQRLGLRDGPACRRKTG